MPEGCRITELALPAPAFARFTFPRYRPLLAGTGHPGTTPDRIAIGLWAGEQPAGLAFWSVPQGDAGDQRELLSVMVSPLLRRNGLGRCLLEVSERRATARGTRRLTAVHTTQLAARIGYEALLAAAGWSAPQAFEHRQAGHARWALDGSPDWAPFLDRLRTRGWGCTAWTDLAPVDREQMAALVQNELPAEDKAFDPLRVTPETLLPALSLVLRRGTDIVGWILAMRGAEPDTVYYGNGYALPSLRRAGWLLGGVWEVCRRQAELLGPDTIAVYATASHNAGMRRFMEGQTRRGHALWTDVRFWSEKRLP